MLPRAHRLRRSAEFAQVVRGGSRGGSSSLVVHLTVRSDSEPVRAGFAVNRSVGNAVHRNLVRRRLQSLVADRVPHLPPHTSMVVRALPAADGTDYRRLGDDLDRCLATAVRRASQVTRESTREATRGAAS